MNKLVGPVDFHYLEGDVGDGTERRFLLLGDIHDQMNSYDNGIEVMSFINMLASMTSYPINLIIEEDNMKNPRNPINCNDYLSNIIQDSMSTSHFLQPNIHIQYADNRWMLEYEEVFYQSICKFKRERGILANEIMGYFSDLYPTTTENVMFKSGLLDQLALLHDTIQPKIKDIISKHVLRTFRRCPKYTSILNILHHSKTYNEEIVQVLDNALKCHIDQTNAVFDAYVVSKMLQQQNSTSLYICYIGADHVHGISKLLRRLGIKLVHYRCKNTWENNNLSQYIPLETLVPVIDRLLDARKK